MKTILLVGESWTSSATHYKGWDQFSSTTFHLGAKDLIKSVESEEIKIDYMVFQSLLIHYIYHVIFVIQYID